MTNSARNAVTCVPGFTREDVRGALAAHQRCAEGGAGRLIKDAPHSRVTIVSGRPGGPALCVKEYRWRGWLRRLRDLLRPSPALREWRAAGQLQRLEISAARLLALVRPPLWRPGTSAFLITEAIEDARQCGRYAWHAFAANDRARKLAFIRACADHLCALHAAGVCHGDLKASNLLVREQGDGWRFVVIDLADVSMQGRVGRRCRVRNLAQLNSSVPPVITRTDRLRFLRRYGEGVREVQPLRETWRAVRRLTETRLCIWQRNWRALYAVESETPPVNSR